MECFWKNGQFFLFIIFGSPQDDLCHLGSWYSREMYFRYSNPPPRSNVFILILKKATQDLNGPNLLFCVWIANATKWLICLCYYCTMLDFFMFRFEHGYLHHILFFALQTFRNVNRSILRSFNYFSHTLWNMFLWIKYATVMKGCWFHKFSSKILSTRYLFLFFVSLDVE